MTPEEEQYQAWSESEIMTKIDWQLIEEPLSGDYSAHRRFTAHKNFWKYEGADITHAA
jgi:hypothetical protein